jgi:hypothetical protein
MVQVVQTRADAGETISDGTFKLSLNYSTIEETASIASDATAATFQAALEALANIDTTTVPKRDQISVAVTRGSVDAQGGYTWSVTFIPHGQHVQVPLMTVTAESISAVHNVSNVVVTTHDGIGAGDMVVITFDRGTNYPSLSSKAAFDAVFYTVASLGADYTAEWAWELLSGTAQVTNAGSSIATTTDDLRSSLFRGDRVKISVSEGFVHSTDSYSSNTLPLATPYLGSNTGTGLPIYRQSFDKILVTIVNVTGTAPFADTAVGSWLVAVKATGNVKTTDESSIASTSISARLTGSWGQHDVGPQIQSVTAADDGNQEGIGEGDTITIVFDKDTNMPNTELEVQKVEIFNATGGTFTLTYESEATTNLAFNAAASAVQSAIETLLTVRSGGVTVTTTADTNGTAAWLVTFETSCALGSGDLSALVGDSSNLVSGASLSVSEVTKGNKVLQAGVESIFAFSNSIGQTYTGYWSATTTLKLTILNQSYAATVEKNKGWCAGGFSEGIVKSDER